jgi:hypothetical protein
MNRRNWSGRFLPRGLDAANATEAFAGSEMMHAKCREGAVMDVVAVARRLAEEAEVRRRRAHDWRGRDDACGVEQPHVVMGRFGDMC